MRNSDDADEKRGRNPLLRARKLGEMATQNAFMEKLAITNFAFHSIETQRLGQIFVGKHLSVTCSEMELRK